MVLFDVSHSSGLTWEYLVYTGLRYSDEEEAEVEAERPDLDLDEYSSKSIAIDLRRSHFRHFPEPARLGI